MDRDQLYDKMAERKSKPKDFGSYIGDNGRVNRCVQLIKEGKLKRGGVLLDVGGGIGDLAYATTKQENFFNWAHVLDISSKNLEAAASKGFSGILADVDKVGIPSVDQYDLITALDFIEHIVDPENFARECFRVLKPGGEVFINTPNIRFWRHIEQLVLVGSFPHTSGDREVYHGGHLAFYTFKDIQEIFGKAGFGGFERFKDEECYEQPVENSIAGRVISNCKNQGVYKELCLEFGCPNLLFKAVKS